MYFIALFLALLDCSNLVISLLQDYGAHIHHSTANHSKQVVHQRKCAVKPPSDSFQVAGDWDPFHTAKPEQIVKYGNKGRFMSDCLLLLSDEDAGKAWPDPHSRTPRSASSLFQGTLEVELQTWGWTEGPHPLDACNFGTPGGGANIKSALDALGLNFLPQALGGDTVCYAVHHYIEHAKNEKGEIVSPYNQVYMVNGQQYHRTGATCEFGINHIGGALFGRALYAPFQCAAEDWRTLGVTPTWAMMPALRHASDIMAGYWLRGNPNPRGLKYYFAIGIQNDETLALIASILLDKGIYDMPAWPGVTLDATGDDWGAKVLLGSPIGATITFLLLQHKAELGIKHITEIVILKDDVVPGVPDPEDDDGEEDVVVHLLFKIADVPPLKEKEDEVMPDYDNHGDKERNKGTIKDGIGFGGRVVRREYMAGKGVRVHEFRMG